MRAPLDQMEAAQKEVCGGSLEGQREPPKYKATFLGMKEELLSAARTRIHLCHGSFRRGGYRERNPKGLQER